MAEQTINGVPQPPLLPPATVSTLPVPSSSVIISMTQSPRVPASGASSLILTSLLCPHGISQISWSFLTFFLFLLSFSVIGMGSNEKEGYYFYARERKSKSAGSKRNNRVIKVNKQAFWKLNFSDDVWEDGLLWGKRNTLNYFSGPNAKTDWLMYEFVLDPSLANGNDGNVVLCNVYKKKDSKEEKRGRGPEGSNVMGKGKTCPESSEKGAKIVPCLDVNSGQPLKRRRMNSCFPQLNQKTQFVDGALSSATPLNIKETHHSEAAIQPSFSTEPYLKGFHQTEVVVSSTANHCVDTAPVDDDPKLYYQLPAALGSANPYIRETLSEAVIQPSFSTEPYIEGIHLAEVAASSTTNQCVDAAPVDDPKLYYQPPSAFGSAMPYSQETHSADAAPCTINHSSPAEPCTMDASSSSSITPTDDRNVYYTEPEWEQEIQQYLSFDPIDQLNDSDDFDREYFTPFFNM
ncbi:hypothetical protein SLEP1_g3800 [Rubroshorea leprosula]|uniref:NAC domain-containing protein n=1 Tax=Rubroshorea leprosula TaxID=152421 RepID=A0AAV5HX56_9ROSI|nr:hypothetical protein SLEP1_g3800 [Rubroshorea leprosula]